MQLLRCNPSHRTTARWHQIAGFGIVAIMMVVELRPGSAVVEPLRTWQAFRHLLESEKNVSSIQGSSSVYGLLLIASIPLLTLRYRLLTYIRPLTSAPTLVDAGP